MSQAVPDEVLAPHLQQMGLATQEQLDSAVRLQAQAAQGGQLISLGQALVQMEVLTPVLLENIEKKLAAHQAGGLTQLGPYKLDQKLGEGGMGAVYLAEDTQMGRPVAVKVLRPKLAENPESLSRFKREAIAAGRLNHVNIAAAYLFAEEAGIYYYAMEYCDGEPLDKYIKRVRFLPEEEALQLILQVASGLQHAHQHGLIHRDIKPGNIFVTQEGVAKILDLGLSKNVVPGGESFQTMTGVAMGTPHYISPEQARGERNIDGRTDIYSLGATFYHLVTGETPFHGSTAAAVLVKHLHEQLPNPQDLNPDLSDGAVHVIAKMMAKDPADRYANCTELLEDLERVLNGEEPSSAAVDEEHSSVAMRRVRLPAAPPREPRPAGREAPGEVRETPAGGRRASPAVGVARPRTATPAAPLGAVEVGARRRSSAAERRSHWWGLTIHICDMRISMRRFRGLTRTGSRCC